MKVGITGSRNGLTMEQRVVLSGMLKHLHRNGATELHHGDCVGVDAEAAEIARKMGYRIVSHPPTEAALRAFTEADETREAADYLTRDRAIVDSTDVLLGFLESKKERRGSGTWYTVNYAIKEDKSRVVVIGPDGHPLRGTPLTNRT